MASKISWEFYRSFLAVLNAGSFSAGARALGLSQPTIGRHIEALEAGLGVALFTRSQAGLLPTDAALGLRDYAEAMESTAAAMERLVTSSAEHVSGTVRITASEVVGVEILPDILARLRREHPAIKVELVSTNDIQDLLLREADIAIRMRRPQQEQLIARQVGHVALGMFAHEDYLRRCGTPNDASDLGAHSLIGFDRTTAFIREASLALPGLHRDAFAFRADSDVAQLALIRAGAGIGICQVGLARRSSVLRQILPHQYSMKLEVWVTMHRDFRNLPAYRVTFDALARGLATSVASQRDHDSH